VHLRWSGGVSASRTGPGDSSLNDLAGHVAAGNGSGAVTNFPTLDATVVFEAAQNSSCNFARLAGAGLHYVSGRAVPLVVPSVGLCRPVRWNFRQNDRADDRRPWPYTVRTRIGRRRMTTTARRRSRRMELRTTPEERELIDRAAAATGTDLTAFVISHAYDAARRVLANRDRFDLDPSALQQWEAINGRPARELAGLRRLMGRRSPFTE